MSHLFYGSTPGSGGSISGSGGVSLLNVGIILTRVQELDFERVPMWAGAGHDYQGTIFRLTLPDAPKNGRH